jgi:hypothetical protein
MVHGLLEELPAFAKKSLQLLHQQRALVLILATPLHHHLLEPMVLRILQIRIISLAISNLIIPLMAPFQETGVQMFVAWKTVFARY